MSSSPRPESPWPASGAGALPPPPPAGPPPPPPNPGRQPVPPAPSYGATPTPPPPPGTYGPQGSMPYGAPGPMPTGNLYNTIAHKPPRPATPLAGILMLVGAVAIVVGCLLPWLSTNFGGSFNGYDWTPIGRDSSDGAAFTFLAVVLAGFGIATLAARKVLAIMILGIIAAAFSLLIAIGRLSDLSDLTDSNGALGSSIGAGVPVVLVGSGVALAGAIVGCSTRRKWRS